jgi:predicted metal-dependent phosphoesterase TrpH
MGLADLHMHTIYSYDGTASVPAVLKRARQIGLDVIAITDHDEIAGSLKALELAPQSGVEVIPGIEVTTSEGDLLALFVHKMIKPGLSLIDTLIEVGEQGGICIAPHIMATGFGMKSLSCLSIVQALKHPDAARILVGIETFNATTIDRGSSRYARILSERAGLAKTGNSDAHTLSTIGLGCTEFPGRTIEDLIVALYNRTTSVQKGKIWNPAMLLGSWAVNYVGSAFTRLVHAS